MVKNRDFDRASNAARRLVEKLNGMGFPAVFAFGTKDGLIKHFGARPMIEVLDKYKEEIFHHPLWTGEVEMQNTVSVPDLPCSIESLNHTDAKTHITALVRAGGSGVGGIGWGKPEKRPSWWLENIPWTKRGVQQNIPLRDMRRLIEAAHRHLNLTKGKVNVNDSMSQDEADTATSDTPDEDSYTEELEESVEDDSDVIPADISPSDNQSPEDSLEENVLSQPIIKILTQKNVSQGPQEVHDQSPHFRVIGLAPSHVNNCYNKPKTTYGSVMQCHAESSVPYMHTLTPKSSLFQEDNASNLNMKRPLKRKRIQFTHESTCSPSKKTLCTQRPRKAPSKFTPSEY